MHFNILKIGRNSDPSKYYIIIGDFLILNRCNTMLWALQTINCGRSNHLF